MVYFWNRRLKLLVNRHNKGSYRKNYYKARPVWQRYHLKKRVVAGLKILPGLFLVFLLSALYMFVYGVFTQCSYFKADNIEIAGIHRLTEEAVLEQAAVSTGKNILSINLSSVRNRLLAHPDIEEADVERKLPNGLIIRIQEHEPLAVVDLGRKFLMDVNGKIYKECKEDQYGKLPLITGLDFSDIGLSGKNGNDPYMAVMNILLMGKDAKSVLHNASIRKICVDREVGITLYAHGETKAIKLGYGNYADKFKRLEKVTLFLKNRHQVTDIESIDLMNTGRIVVNPTSEKTLPLNGKEV